MEGKGNGVKDLKQIAKLEMRVSPQLLWTCGTDDRSHYRSHYNEDSFRNALKTLCFIQYFK